MNNYVVCLGTRGDGKRVRCIKLSGTQIYPPYGEEPTWKPLYPLSVQIIPHQKRGYNNNLINNTINDTVVIPNKNTKITGYQCWSSCTENTKHISYVEFFDLLKKLSSNTHH